jgi:hypothetical protein
VIYSLKLLAKSLTYKVWDLTYSVEAFGFSKGLKPPQGLVQQTGPRDTAKRDNSTILCGQQLKHLCSLVKRKIYKQHYLYNTLG